MLGCKEIYNKLVNETKEVENRQGILNISKFVDSNIDKNENLYFIDDYRKLIRTNSWYYLDDTASDYYDLLQRWIKTHEFYIESAEEFFVNLSEKKDITNKIYDKALISETLRGREGKRSKIGLDSFLDSYISKLTRMIYEEFGSGEVEDITGLFASSINLPLFSAENELFIDFYEYNKKINEPLNYNNFEDIEKETNGLSSKILREYCKYSFKDFKSKHSKLKTSEELMTKKIDFLKSMKNEREFLKDKVYSSIISKSGKEAADFLRVIDRIDDLNYLNSNVEVKFSFKGWPGLFHHFIFREGNFYPDKGDIYHERFVNMCKETGGYNWNSK